MNLIIIQSDRYVCAEACSQSAEALMYATLEVQNDPGVVSAAVRKSGWALEFASLVLRANRTIVVEAVGVDIPEW